MTTRRRTIWLALALAAVACATLFAYDYVVKNADAERAARIANEAIAQAVRLSEKAQERSLAAQAALTRENFQTHRAELSEKARAAATLSREAAILYRKAAEIIDDARSFARSEHARTYWELQRKSLERRADTAQFAAEANSLAADESILDYETMLIRLHPITARAEAARQDSLRYADEAKAILEKHKGKL